MYGGASKKKHRIVAPEKVAFRAYSVGEKVGHVEQLSRKQICSIAQSGISP